MFFNVYVSSATVPLSRSELRELLTQSRADNARAGITGMLLYKDGNFMQALEGDEQAVRSLYEKIGRDPRHHGMITILEGPLAERQFPDWSMGFCDLNSPAVHSTPGYSEFLNTPLTGAEFSSRPQSSQKLLLMFKRNMALRGGDCG